MTMLLHTPEPKPCLNLILQGKKNKKRKGSIITRRVKAEMQMHEAATHGQLLCLLIQPRGRARRQQLAQVPQRAVGNNSLQ